jgi:hypothetical protein
MLTAKKECIERDPHYFVVVLFGPPQSLLLVSSTASKEERVWESRGTSHTDSDSFGRRAVLDPNKTTAKISVPLYAPLYV